MTEPVDPAADQALDFLDGCADKWAADVNLFAMIQNIVSPMRLSRRAPDEVRETFIRRMEQNIDALIRQAWVEGACYGKFGDTAVSGEIEK